jgi:hypothetical protein
MPDEPERPTAKRPRSGFAFTERSAGFGHDPLAPGLTEKPDLGIALARLRRGFSADPRNAG